MEVDITLAVSHYYKSRLYGRSINEESGLQHLVLDTVQRKKENVHLHLKLITFVVGML